MGLRMTRLLPVVTLAVLAWVAPAAAGKDTLVIGMPTDVPIFDTHKATGLHNGSILNQVSEPLVLLTTKAQYAPLINTLGYHWIVVYSKAQIEKVGDDNLHTAPVGSGPFKFVHHKRG